MKKIDNIPKLTYFNNPYKAHVPWPPNFSKLNAQQQFRLEKKYRRRAKNKWTRPRWNQATKIVQWTLGICEYNYG